MKHNETEPSLSSQQNTHYCNDKINTKKPSEIRSQSKHENYVKHCDSVSVNHKNHVLSSETPQLNNEFYVRPPYFQYSHDVRCQHPTKPVRPSPSWQNTNHQRDLWHGVNFRIQGSQSLSSTAQTSDIHSKYGPTNQLITVDLHNPLYPSMSQNRTGASLSNKATSKQNKVMAAEIINNRTSAKNVANEECNTKETENIGMVKDSEIGSNKQKSLIVKEYKNPSATKAMFIQRQSNIKKVLPAHLLSTITSTVKQMSSVEKQSLNPPQGFRNAKRKTDPVNDKLRFEACVLGEMKGPKLPKLEEERREMFKDNETGDVSLHYSVAEIRKQVMQVC